MKRALWAACAAAISVIGCESEFQPEIEEGLVVDATFVEWSQDRVEQGRVPVLDGVVNNIEWGSPDDPDRPYSYVQLTAENGFGSPGAPKFLAVKAAYTALWRPDLDRYILRDVYFVVQWADLTPSEYANSLVYEGPDLADLEPRVRSYFVNQGLTEPALTDAVEDSLITLFYDGTTPRPENWRQEGGDDRLLVLIGTGDEEGTEGRLFRNFGTPIARNGESFGPLGAGMLDAWWWSASRTNRLAEAFNIDDVGGDSDPIEGYAGYADDYHIDTMDPIMRDDGPRLYLPNFNPALPPADRVPLRAWRPQNDLNFGNTTPSHCSSINMGVDFPWLHRGAVRGARLEPTGSDPRYFNYRVYEWDTKQPDTAGLWSPGQFVTGYLLGHDFLDRSDLSLFDFCLPGCPRPVGENDVPNCQGQPYDTRPLHSINTLQVRAHGRYDPIVRHWIVELARPVTTPWGNTNDDGEPVQDMDFDGLLTGERDFYVSFALWDNQPVDGGSYWGSPAVRIHFEPPPPRED